MDPTGDGVTLTVAGGERLTGRTVLANCAPSTLAGLLGETAPRPEGSQVKINIVLRRLPTFRSGIDPATGFAGTLHLHQSYDELAQAYATAAAGEIPDPLPCESYCHSLTDPSIVAPALREQGFHTLTIFGLHTPARLFDHDHDAVRDRVLSAALASLQSVLAEPLADCIASDAHGEPCIEVMSPQDVEREARLPGGQIFHGDLAWPWLADGEDASHAGRALGGGDQPPVDPAVRVGSPAWRCGQRTRWPQRGDGGAGEVALITPGDPAVPRPANRFRELARRFASVSPRAPLAQLAEQLTLNQRVGGSIPSRRTVRPDQAAFC